MNISNSLLDSLLALNLRYKLVLIGLLAVCGFEPASASQCDAHFPFDGTLADATGNGYNGMMIAEGDAGEPQFGEGKYGQALHITGNAAMRAFLDLHHETCPQFTITAWFKLPSVEVGGPQAILSTGARGGIPAVVASGSTLMLYGKGNGLWQKDAIQDGNTWFFVAATFDYEAGIYKLYWRNRPQDGKLSETPYDAEDAFWIGTRSDEVRYMAQDLYVDEVRVYGRVLDLGEIRDVSRNVVAHDTAQTQTTVSAITDASSAVPVPFGNQAEIEIPEDAVRTRPPLGQLPAFPATSEADPTAWNNPEQQIADPNSQAVIFGTVTDTTGRGVPDTLVRVLRAANGKRIAKTRTGSDGRYEVAVFASEPVKVEFHNMLVFPHASIEYAGRTWSLDQASLIKIKPGQEVEINPELQLYTCRFEGSVEHRSGLRLPGSGLAFTKRVHTTLVARDLCIQC